MLCTGAGGHSSWQFCSVVLVVSVALAPEQEDVSPTLKHLDASDDKLYNIEEIESASSKILQESLKHANLSPPFFQSSNYHKRPRVDNAQKQSKQILRETVTGISSKENSHDSGLQPQHEPIASPDDPELVILAGEPNGSSGSSAADAHIPLSMSKL